MPALENTPILVDDAMLGFFVDQVNTFYAHAPVDWIFQEYLEKYKQELTEEFFQTVIHALNQKAIQTGRSYRYVDKVEHGERRLVRVYQF